MKKRGKRKTALVYDTGLARRMTLQFFNLHVNFFYVFDVYDEGCTAACFKYHAPDTALLSWAPNIARAWWCVSFVC